MPNSDSFLLRVHQSDRMRVRASIMRALSTCEPFQFQHRAVRMDHEIRVLRTRGTIERGEDGKPALILGISQDITELHATDKRAHVRLVQVVRRALDREERDRGRIAKDLREHVTEPLITLSRKLATINASRPACDVGPAAAQPVATESAAAQSAAAQSAAARSAAARSAAVRSVAAQIEDCIRALNAACASTLQVIGHLRPSVLEEHGLFAALRAEALRVGRQAAIPVSVCGEEISPRLPPGVEATLFRLAQEAIANAARHAGCTLIRVSLTGTTAHTRLEIQDNGSGFDITTLAGSDTGEPRGIALMRERAESVSASFRLSSQPGSGARITVDYRG
jgi:signal transduction histidine kinase